MLPFVVAGGAAEEDFFAALERAAEGGVGGVPTLGGVAGEGTALRATRARAGG